jgi:hypothetical protein
MVGRGWFLPLVFLVYVGHNCPMWKEKSTENRLVVIGTS